MQQSIPHGVDASYNAAVRLILYHKTPASGRTRFLCQPEGICVMGSLPKLAEILETDEQGDDIDVVLHPAPALRRVAQWLNLRLDDMEIDAEYCEHVDVPGGPLTIYLARFTTIDPPFAAVELVGGRFIALTDGLSLTAVELELLRRAYVMIMED